MARSVAVQWARRARDPVPAPATASPAAGARGVASSIVGADKEELDKMAGEVNLPGVSLSEEAEKIKKETGRKVLNMWDMMKIQGEI